jgi:hypothetical protein
VTAIYCGLIILFLSKTIEQNMKNKTKSRQEPGLSHLVLIFAILNEGKALIFWSYFLLGGQKLIEVFMQKGVAIFPKSN